MNRILTGLILCVAVFLTSCGGTYDLGSSAPTPTDVVVTPGDSSATVTWTMQPGVSYWIFYAPTTDAITTASWANYVNAHSAINAVSPQLITGLTNGTTYSFTINARIGNGAGGPGSPAQAIVPRIAGGTWVVGTPLGSGDLSGAAVSAQAVLVGSITTTLYTFVAVGSNGKIFTSTDGKSWTAQNSSVSVDLRGVGFSTYHLAVGANGTIMRSADAITWSAVNSNTTDTLNAVASNTLTTHVAVGNGGTIVTSNDNGATWSAVNSGTGKDLYAIAFGSTLDAAGRATSVFMAAGAQGTLLFSTDGANWSSGNSNTNADLRGIAFTAAVVGLTTAQQAWVAVGSNGTAINSTDGVNWTVRGSNTNNTLNAVAYNNRFVAVGNNGSIVTSDDGGVTWQLQNSNTSNQLNAIAHNLYGFAAVGAVGTNLSGF